MSTTNNRIGARAIDDPLVEPEGDLLDMDKHAQALADFIKQDRKLPFTIGIFGEWGEGKTTMVNFVKRHLHPRLPNGEEGPLPFHFVTFSAWPYTTSEKLWRALILEIAKVLYDIPKETDKEDATHKQEANSDKERPDLFAKLSAFLHGDLFRKKPPPPKETKYQKYENLKVELNGTGYGRISNRTPKESLDQEAVISAVVDGALSVLGTVSPLAAGIRTFIGGEPKSNSKGNADAPDGQKPTGEVDALTNFQQIFRELIASRLGKDPVYVFIDDLDRAQPDVALDIMESIRIALSECDCVYILAVDERLISQGLRLRYRELFEKEAEFEIASKGQEYLEKIIQFRTRVPHRTAEQTQRLIAAEFPHWTPAGDIIQSIVGNNPRRVKQYCQRLSFQNAVGNPFSVGSGPADENARLGLVEEGESDVSELVTLSRLLRPPGFEVAKINELFVELQELSQSYAGGSELEKLNSLLQKYDREGRLEEVRTAVELIRPGLLPARNKRP